MPSFKIVLFVGALIVSACQKTLPAQRTLEIEEANDRIDRILRSRGFSENTPGCSVTIAKEGQIVFGRGYGSENPDTSTKPIDTHTSMRLNSLSKSIVSTGILILQEQQKRDLLQKTLGQIYIDKNIPIPLQPISIKHLLEHSSGLPLEIDEKQASQFTTVLEDSQAIDFLVSHPPSLRFPPGTRYAYSNVGYWLLADILSRESGKEWRHFLKEAIFDRLDMRSAEIQPTTLLIQKKVIAPSFVLNKEKSFEPFQLEKDWEWRAGVLGSGGIHMNGEAIIRFLYALKTYSLLSRSSLELALLSSELSDDDDPQLKPSHYSLGWMVFPESMAQPQIDKLVYRHWHTGGGTGYYTYMENVTRLQPPCSLQIAMLCNENGALMTDRAELTDSIRALYCSIE